MLGAYDSSDEDEAHSASQSSSTVTTVALPAVSSAPAVREAPEAAVTSRALVAAFSKEAAELKHNLPYSQLFAPAVGPENPFRPGNSAPNASHSGAVIEEHNVDHSVFEEQYYAFNAKASAGSDVGDSSGFGGSGKEVVAGGKRKRSSGWTPLFDEDEDSEENVVSQVSGVKNAKVAVETQGEESKSGSKPTAKRAEEHSEFHGTSLYDYQGRSYIHPPSHLKPKQHKCYVPKRLTHTYTGHTKGINAIRFFPEYGHLLLSASMDSTVKLWDVYNQRTCLRTFHGHSEAVRDICFSNDGTKFLSASYDKTIKLWDTETGECISKFSTGKTPYCVKFHPTKQNEFVAGQSDRRITQWDINSKKVMQKYDEHLGSVNTITFVDFNRRFVSTSDDKKMLVWEYGIPVVIKHISDPTMQSMPATATHPTESWMACQSLDNQIVVYGTRDRFKMNKKKRFVGHECAGFAIGLTFSADGQYLASGDSLGRYFVWDWKSCRSVASPQVHEKVTIDVKWHPIDPSKMATCSWDGTIKLWD